MSRSWTILRLQKVIANIECAYERREPTADVMNHMFSSTEKTTPKIQKKSMPWYWVSETLSRKIVPRHTTSKNSSR